MCPTANFLVTGGFRSSFNYFKIYAWSVYTHAVVAAFPIYAQRGEDVAIGGGWRPCFSHRNYFADHGKSWKNHGIVFLNFYGNPAMAATHLTLGLCLFRPNKKIPTCLG